MATKEQLIHKIKYLTNNQLKSLLDNLAKTKDIDTTLLKKILSYQVMISQI